MTKGERAKPSTIDPKRKRRIAAGSGTRVEDVNRLLRQYEQMQKMMKQFKKNPKGFGRGMKAWAACSAKRRFYFGNHGALPR